MDTFDKILSSVIGLAILSVVVSKNAQTGGVIQAFATGFGSILATVVAPVTGAATASTAAARTATTANAGAATAASIAGGASGLLNLTNDFPALTTGLFG